MSDDEDVLLALEFHDDGLETDDHVPVRFTASIPIVELVVIPRIEILRVLLLKNHTM